MSASEAEATLSGSEVVVESREVADSLFQNGYGTMREGGGSTLSRCEALYLLSERRVRVVEGGGCAVSFQFLLERFRAEDADIWTKYLLFRDLRSRGYVVKDGFGLGIDFRMYERGTFGKRAAKYVVYAVCEGCPVSAGRLEEALRLVHGMKKELLVAAVDMRGEIVYYSLSRFNLELRSGGSEQGQGTSAAE